jgi:hypothetical protein
MAKPAPTQERWTLDLEGMPHFDTAMQRVEAWYQNEIIDRPPIRFKAHNAFLNAATDEIKKLSREGKKAWWFDVERQVDLFLKSIKGRNYHGETFPIYFPNLGPEIYAAFYGADLIFGEATSYAEPLVKDWKDIDKPRLEMDNEYFKKIEELIRHALERCEGKFMVGYTDLHPGLDCAAAWRDPQKFCMDLFDNPEGVMKLAELAIAEFEMIYDHFDALIKARKQLSVSWMGIPSFGKMHIPSCDFSSLISPEFFNRFGLPILEREVKTMSHNIFHMDGRGVAKHLDAILSVPEVHAIQWVQGVGDDYSILQWVPFIKELQAKSVPVVVDLAKAELDEFMAAMDPHGLFLWLATENEAEEIELIKRVEKWS